MAQPHDLILLIEKFRSMRYNKIIIHQWERNFGYGKHFGRVLLKNGRKPHA